MVGLKLFNPNHLGLVTVIAVVTGLFVAAVVDGERDIHFDTDHESDVFLKCEESSSKSWTVDFDEKDSPKKKVFKLPPESEGCFTSKNYYLLNATSNFVVKFYTDSPQDEGGNIIVRLDPMNGNCPGKDCVWEVSKDPKYKTGEWVTAEHKFPLKATKGYYVHLKSDKGKGKFLLDSLTISGAVNNYPEEAGQQFETINVPVRLAYDNGTGGADGFGELSKNLLFTSASVLTLNNILN